jgi:hypothetical protein
MDDLFCAICGSPMELVHRFPNHVTKTGTKCRRRRFGCTVCDFQTTIYADGYFDMEATDRVGKKIGKNLFKEITGRRVK